MDAAVLAAVSWCLAPGVLVQQVCRHMCVCEYPPCVCDPTVILPLCTGGQPPFPLHPVSMLCPAYSDSLMNISCHSDSVCTVRFCTGLALCHVLHTRLPRAPPAALVAASRCGFGRHVSWPTSVLLLRHSLASHLEMPVLLKGTHTHPAPHLTI